MLTKIIPENCIACGLCQLKAPHLFDYNEIGLVVFKDEPLLNEKTIPSDLEGECLAAYKKCPTRAIVIDK